MIGDVEAGSLFPCKPTIHFHPEIVTCPHCGAKPEVKKTRGKTVVTLDIGAFIAKETILHCPRDGTLFVSEQLRALVERDLSFARQDNGDSFK